MGFAAQVQIHLDANEFADDQETFEIAKTIAEHAEIRRAQYRRTEASFSRGAYRIERFWSDSVPWYEWLSDPQVLQTCAKQSGLPSWMLAEVLASKIRPDNWQVFFWMGVAFRGLENEEVMARAVRQLAARIDTERAERQSKARADLAKAGAVGKLASDPRQEAKAIVHECWIDWQKQPGRYSGKAAFARDMLDKFPTLKSQPVIEGWCRSWEREA